MEHVFDCVDFSMPFYGNNAYAITNKFRSPNTRPDEKGICPDGKTHEENWLGQVDSKTKRNEKHIAEEYYYRDPRIYQNKPAFADVPKEVLAEVKENSQREARNFFKEVANRQTDKKGAIIPKPTKRKFFTVPVIADSSKLSDKACALARRPKQVKG